jgi:hypothetical protein
VYAIGIFIISQSPVHSNRHLASSHIVAKDVQSLNANCSVAIVQLALVLLHNCSPQIRMMQCASKSLPSVIMAAFPEYDLGSVGDIVKRGEGSGLVVLRDRLEVLRALSKGTCTHIIAPVDCSVVGAANPVTLVRACAKFGMALDLAQVLDAFSQG